MDQATSADHALRIAGPDACLSHETAARLQGISLVPSEVERVTVPRSRSRVVIPGWLVVRADVPPLDLTTAAGLRCTRPVRTVVDLARSAPLHQAVVAADSAMRAGLASRAALAERLTQARGRGAAQPRRVARLMDPRAESVLESLVRLVLVEAVPPPICQYVIRDPDGTFVARVDFCWPAQRLVVEADGYAHHSCRADYRRDRARQNALERRGWRVPRVTWEDTHRPAYIVALVRECLAAAA